jgi:hypothetical protein
MSSARGLIRGLGSVRRVGARVPLPREPTMPEIMAKTAEVKEATEAVAKAARAKAAETAAKAAEAEAATLANRIIMRIKNAKQKKENIPDTDTIFEKLWKLKKERAGQLVEETGKTIVFYKFIADSINPLLGFALQQLERTANKDFKTLYDILKQANIKPVINELYKQKLLTKFLKDKETLLKIVKDKNPNLEKLEEAIEIAENYTVVGIKIRTKEWFTDMENILNTYRYFKLVISIKLICTIIAIKYKLFTIPETPEAPEFVHYWHNNAIVHVGNNIHYEMPHIEQPLTLNNLKTLRNEQVKKVAGKTANLAYCRSEEKYITLIRKLPSVLYAWYELQNMDKMIYELEKNTDNSVTEPKIMTIINDIRTKMETMRENGELPMETGDIIDKYFIEFEKLILIMEEKKEMHKDILHSNVLHANNAQIKFSPEEKAAARELLINIAEAIQTPVEAHMCRHLPKTSRFTRRVNPNNANVRAAIRTINSFTHKKNKPNNKPINASSLKN